MFWSNIKILHLYFKTEWFEIVPIVAKYIIQIGKVLYNPILDETEHALIFFNQP